MWFSYLKQDKDQDQPTPRRPSKDGQVDVEEKKRTRKDSGSSIIGVELKKKAPSIGESGLVDETLRVISLFRAYFALEYSCKFRLP